MAKATIDSEGLDVRGMARYLKINLHWEEGNAVVIRQVHSGAAAVIKGSKNEKLVSRW